MLSYVCFHNFYTSAITISHTTVRTDDSGRSPHWQVVLPKLTLMADPHCEDDAQRYHELMHSSQHRRLEVGAALTRSERCEGAERDACGG